MSHSFFIKYIIIYHVKWSKLKPCKKPSLFIIFGHPNLFIKFYGLVHIGNVSLLFFSMDGKSYPQLWSQKTIFRCSCYSMSLPSTSLCVDVVALEGSFPDQKLILLYNSLLSQLKIYIVPG